MNEALSELPAPAAATPQPVDSDQVLDYAGSWGSPNWFVRLVFLGYRPLGRTIRRLQWAGLALVLWGEALLPGAAAVALAGLLLIAIAFSRSAIHLIWYLPLAVLAKYRSFRLEQRLWAPWLGLLLMAAALAFDLPARLTLALSGAPLRAALHDVYAVQPHDARPPALQMAGPFLLSNLHPSPMHVRFEFAFGRVASYTEPHDSTEGVVELQDRSLLRRVLLFFGLDVGGRVRCG